MSENKSDFHLKMTFLIDRLIKNLHNSKLARGSYLETMLLLNDALQFMFWLYAATCLNKECQ